MLKIAASLTLTLLACLAPAAHAQEKGNDAGLCKSVCASARQECRAHVQQATQDDTSPALTMKPSRNPYVAAGRGAAPQSQQLRPTEAEAFRARRAERLQACEVQYRSCTRSCG